jgi:hypothetical protein
MIFYRKESALHGEVKYKLWRQIQDIRIESFPVKEAAEKGVWKGLLFKDVVERK